MRWFQNHCNYAHVIGVVDYKFLMKLDEIRELQNQLRKNLKTIKQQIALNYVAIPVPSEIYSKEHMEISSHPTWYYNNRFKVIITTKEEENEVNKFIKKKKRRIFN